ncbi:MAG: ABC transporter permease [Spirochaetia bacterium]|jgi:ABC-2 type transport system permease protein
MSKLAKIIRMEFRLTVANRVFIVLTILGPFLIAAVTILPGLLSTSVAGMGAKATKIALLGADRRFVQEISPALLQSKIEVSAVQGSVESLDSQVKAGAYDGYLVMPPDFSEVTRLEYVSKNSADFRVMGVLQGVIGKAIVAQRLVKAGIAASQVASLTQLPGFEMRQLTQGGERKENSDFITILVTGLTLAMLLYMTVVLYGQVIGRSVLTEKTNKTVEIMLSSVRPMELLFGKILGKALASLLQYGIWVTVSAAVLKLIGPRIGISIGVGLSMSTLAYLVLFFILAFFLYCSLYAALGAASEDEQHLGQLAWPVIIFLVIPVVMITSIISTPRAPVIVALSLFPLTAPIVMFLRILVGAAEPWEILVSIGLIVATTAAVIWLSARIFRVGILMTGKRFKFLDVLRLVRYR